ncbi:MAG: OmpA family protein [Bacteroidales bacterium]|jgi:outer membrane protein OmpA-like peptidoglycan-associated protein|nr:OmpA family protein [Bacteroidales bacterium]
MAAFFKNICLIAFVFAFAGAYAQIDVQFKRSAFPDDPNGLKKAKQDIRAGDSRIKKQNDFEKAIPYYLEAWEFNPNNAALNYTIGSAYWETAEKQKALSFFEKATTLNENVAKYLYLKLGQARHLNYKFESAIEAFNRYLRLNPKLSVEEKSAVNKRVTECRYGMELIQDTVRVEIVNLGENVNTEYAEYNPMIVSDGSKLLFTARRKYIGNPIEPRDGKPCEDVWYADKGEDGEWEKSRKFGSPINTKRHDAVSGMSPDGQELFVYKAVDKKGGDIFYSKLKGEKWSKPEPMPEVINSEYHESKASMSYDGKTLYLVSRRPDDNFGVRDIFVSTMDAALQWSAPQNLGSVINTEYDEEGVFIHPDGRTLYFCSKGHNSMGGFDIFRSVKDSSGNWSTPENLGYPINTPGDEAFWAIASDGRHAYISSVRPDGFGDYDIYEVIFPEPESIDEIQQIDVRLTLFNGFVKDVKTLEPLEAKIEIVDNETNEQIAVLSSNQASGKFIVNLPAGKNYGLSVSKDGYMFHSENFNIKDDAKFQQITREILLQPIEVGTRIVLRNIFFDYDKATLRSESTGELSKVLKILDDNPNMKIEISGHTDNRGSLEYNTKLSRSRAKAVVDYLIEKGIDTERLSYEGYAFTQPISDNDTDEGRQMNRRVEFEVLEND